MSHRVRRGTIIIIHIGHWRGNHTGFYPHNRNLIQYVIDISNTVKHLLKGGEFCILVPTISHACVNLQNLCVLETGEYVAMVWQTKPLIHVTSLHLSPTPKIYMYLCMYGTPFSQTREVIVSFPQIKPLLCFRWRVRLVRTRVGRRRGWPTHSQVLLAQRAIWMEPH